MKNLGQKREWSKQTRASWTEVLDQDRGPEMKMRGKTRGPEMK